MNRTTQQLIDMARRRCDAYGSDAFTDAEIVDYLNMTLWELHGILADSHGDDYLSTVLTGSVSGSEPTLVNSPTGSSPYRILRVDWLRDGDTWTPMHRANLADARWDTTLEDWDGYPPSYRYTATATYFYPPSKNAESVRLIIVPHPTDFSTTALSAVLPDWLEPWYQYLVLGAAVHMLDRIETDVGVVAGLKTAMKAFIERGKPVDDHGYQVINDVEGVTDAERYWTRWVS